jgi:hypothetical protein
MHEFNSAVAPQSSLAPASSERRALRFGLIALAGFVFVLGSAALCAQAVLQRGYDPFVTGANLHETILNTTNVGTNTFGLLFKLPVDDNVYAQPLYVPSVTIPKLGTHKVVYVATMSDTLYAFDADTAGAPLWSINLATSVGAMPVPMATYAYSNSRNIVGNLGILSTPVIDRPSHLMYLVAGTAEAGTIVYRLHAVDIKNGQEPLGPVELSGSYGGLTFNARNVFQRASLTLADNQIVIGFGALEEEFSGGYSGWVMAYDKTTLTQSGIFATVISGGNGGGVWQSGRPPVVGGGGSSVYVFTGNGYSDGYNPKFNNFSESVLMLSPAQGLKLLNWFTPGDWSELDSQDLDLSSSGPMQIPGTHLLAGGGKNGVLYILNSNKLGKFNANDSQVVQKLQVSMGALRGGPVFWQRSTASGGPLLYVWGTTDLLKSYPFNGTTITTNPSATGGNTSLYPGGILALSANGEQTGSGVLWATIASSGDANDNPPVPGALYAFDAQDVSRGLWNTTMNSSRDNFGNFAKFVPPLVVNGKVYIATSSNQLAVYGLLQ